METSMEARQYPQDHHIDKISDKLSSAAVSLMDSQDEHLESGHEFLAMDEGTPPASLTKKNANGVSPDTMDNQESTEASDVLSTKSASSETTVDSREHIVRAMYAKFGGRENTVDLIKSGKLNPLDFMYDNSSINSYEFEVPDDVKCPICHAEFEKDPVLIGQPGSQHSGCYVCETCSEWCPFIANGVCTVCCETIKPDEDERVPDLLLSEALETKKAGNANGPRCGNCDEDDGEPQFATIYCTTCQIPLCDCCKAATHSAKIFKKHELVPVSKIPRPRSALVNSICPMHGKEFQLYNKVTHEMHCLDCYFHQAQDVDREEFLELDHAEPGAHELLRSQHAALLALHSEFTASLSTGRKTLELKKKAFSEWKDSFDDLVAEIISEVQKCSKDAIERVRGELDDVEKLHSTQYKFFQLAQAQFSASTALVSFAMKKPNSLEFLSLQNHIQPRLSRFRELATKHLTEHDKISKPLSQPSAVDILRKALSNLLKLNEDTEKGFHPDFDIVASKSSIQWHDSSPSSQSPQLPPQQLQQPKLVQKPKLVQHSMEHSMVELTATNNIGPNGYVLRVDTNQLPIRASTPLTPSPSNKMKLAAENSINKNSHGESLQRLSLSMKHVTFADNQKVQSPAPPVPGSTGATPGQLSIEAELGELRAKLAKLISLLVYFHCDVSQRRCSPDLKRFGKLGSLSDSIREGILTHKSRAMISFGMDANGHFPADVNPDDRHKRENHIAQLDKLEKDAMDADIGLKRVFAFSEQISDLSGLTTSRQSELQQYQLKEAHEKFLESISLLNPNHSERVKAIEAARLSREAKLKQQAHMAPHMQWQNLMVTGKANLKKSSKKKK